MKKNYWKNLKKITFLFVCWRLLLSIPLFFTYFIPFRKGYEYTTLARFSSSHILSSFPLLSSWSNFDGVHYLAIAGQGYTENGRFFPLYPLFVKMGTLLFGTPQPFGIEYVALAFLISNLSRFNDKCCG